MSKLIHRLTTKEDVDAINIMGCFTLADKVRVKDCVDSNSVLLYTLLKDDKIIGVVGAHFIYSHVADIFTLVDRNMICHPVAYIRKVRELALELFNEPWCIKRAQMTVVCRYKWAKQWIKLVGFEIDCVLKSYGEDNEDHYLCSITEKES
jgi:hypothetical protein